MGRIALPSPRFTVISCRSQTSVVFRWLTNQRKICTGLVDRLPSDGEAGLLLHSTRPRSLCHRDHRLAGEWGHRAAPSAPDVAVPRTNVQGQIVLFAGFVQAIAAHSGRKLRFSDFSFCRRRLWGRLKNRRLLGSSRLLLPSGGLHHATEGVGSGCWFVVARFGFFARRGWFVSKLHGRQQAL